MVNCVCVCVQIGLKQMRQGGLEKETEKGRWKQNTQQGSEVVTELFIGPPTSNAS